MSKVIRNHSILIGILVSVLFLGPLLFNDWSKLDCSFMSYGEIMGYSTMILSLIPVYFSTRVYRNRLDQQGFSFLKGLGIAVTITIIASIIFYGSNLLLYEVVDPTFLADFGLYYERCLLENAQSEAEREIIHQNMEQYADMINNSYLYAFIMAATVFFIGLVISLISALILQRKSDRNIY